MKSRLLIVVFAFISITSFAQDGTKGICNVNLEGQEFVIHVVDVGENLYQISKKYTTTMAEIWKYNPTIQDSVIVPGQVLKIPYTSKPVVKITNPVTKPNPGGAGNVPKQHFDTSKIVYHLVEPKQTLYSISRTYNQPVEKIMEWNNLSDTTPIHPGQKLIVSPYGSVKVVDPVENVVKEIEPSPVPVKQKITLNEQQDYLFTEYQNQKTDSKGGYKSERGSATWLDTGNPMMKSNYFCLSKTAPIGTIVKVTNLMNQRYVLLKVIGKLPETGENENILLRISPAARKDGIFPEGKCYTQIDYYN